MASSIFACIFVSFGRLLSKEFNHNVIWHKNNKTRTSTSIIRYTTFCYFTIFWKLVIPNQTRSRRRSEPIPAAVQVLLNKETDEKMHMVLEKYFMTCYLRRSNRFLCFNHHEVNIFWNVFIDILNIKHLSLYCCWSWSSYEGIVQK